MILVLALSSVIVYLSNREPLLSIDDESMTEINNEIADLQSVINNNNDMNQRSDLNSSEEGKKEGTRDDEEIKDVEVEY
jgi:hypothetical protein